MKELEYPFDSEYILNNKKKIKKKLQLSNNQYIRKNIAILGGSTTSNIKLMLELFLLNYGIKPIFYESEYNQYYQDAIFPNKQLEKFHPDIIFIHTTNRNIMFYPHIGMSGKEIDQLIEAEIERYISIWDRLDAVYQCPIIQNNFEYPSYRLMGNKEASDVHGKINFITRLNQRFYEYAQTHDNFYINDINYISACYGLDRWSDPFYWHMYKYACAVLAIPDLAFNIAKIIKAIFGKNKKGFVLDLDNTLWGGVVGDDGADNIEIGQETPIGQVYSEFQSYIKEYIELGVILNINSKNDYNNALAGLNHPEGILKSEDFIVIKSNWEPKDRNFINIANALNLLPESLVFVDDNPAERAIVTVQLPGVAAPEMDSVENYIRILDKSGFFEVTSLSEDDLNRNEMYKENEKRSHLQVSFESYADYLKSLKMRAVIKGFESIYMARIAQLTNKSNQFNLTTRRYTQGEIERVAEEKDYIHLYGKLEDKFGDNGVVSVVIGQVCGENVNICLWIMSCRVLKRDMEFAMMDILVKKCLTKNVKKIYGYYYPTEKNGMVKDLYALLGFTKNSEDEKGNTVWSMDVDEFYEKKNEVIQVEE
ncbi:HAD-IIIC family phosphatase [Lachnotalea glycerini]|uniref:HAD-IIIC family phosphatase n=1 Tax=Lachnotalea glycerini TaxID=1763509 RepID=A0A371JG34_9FIRM|nr:HAD-IIIC family phosphatase [Lachnotalea glycerini]RDY31710.1 HAD-IIIC family phosphatase [Lachnotalea glycerini]